MTDSSEIHFEEVISKVASHVQWHSRFLNTLSLLEYIGARKILKSQKESLVSSEMLAHIAEEIRHAQMLKRVALKMNGELKTYEEKNLLAGPEARAYIQLVDQAGLKKSTDPWQNYLLTTLLLEERAQKLYPFYESVLAQAGFPGVLKAIVKEEETHLNQMLAHLYTGKEGQTEALAQLRVQENIYFNQWMKAVHNFLAGR